VSISFYLLNGVITEHHGVGTFIIPCVEGELDIRLVKFLDVPLVKGGVKGSITSIIDV
jgi:hypothetical protein